VISQTPLLADLRVSFFNFIKTAGIEGYYDYVYSDDRGIPTIGAGYALITANSQGIWSVRPNVESILTEAGLALTKVQWDSLATKLSAAADALNEVEGASNPFPTPPSNILGWTITEAIGQNLASGGVTQAMAALTTWLNSNPTQPQLANSYTTNSYEYFSLLSLAYNSYMGKHRDGTYGSPHLWGALAASNRAAAWYEIRYDTPRTQLRHYAESAIFGLYNPAPNAADAVQIYQMYSQHALSMLAYDKKYQRARLYANDALRLNSDLNPAPNYVVTALSLGDSLKQADGLVLNSLASTDSWLGSASQLSSFASDQNIFVASPQESIISARVLDSGIGASNANNIIFGAESGDSLLGGRGNDIIVAGGGNEYLFAGSGHDALIAGQGMPSSLMGAMGSDTLCGGPGYDEFDILSTGAPSDTTIIAFDDDQKGIIRIATSTEGMVDPGTRNGYEIESSKTGIPGLHNTWVGPDNELESYDPASRTFTILYQQARIEIVDFNIVAATSGQGFLGIYLEAEASLVVGGAGATPPVNSEIAQARTIGSNFETQNSATENFAAGSTSFYTFEIDRPYTTDETLVVTLSGASPEDFCGLFANEDILLTSNGTFSVTLSAGQTQVSFGIVDVSRQDGSSDIASGASLQLSASIADPDQAKSSNSHVSTETLTLHYIPTTQVIASPGKPPVYSTTVTNATYDSDPNVQAYVVTLQGGLGANLQGVGANDIFSLGKATNTSVTGASGGADTLFGGNGDNSYTFAKSNDLLYLSGTNTTVSGGAHDTVYGLSGNVIFSGNQGTDLIFAGAGNNQIFGDKKVDIATALQDQDTLQASGQKGDLIATLDGDSTIVGSLGNDLIFAGAGHDVIVLGPGNDTFLGGEEVTDGFANWSASGSGPNDATINYSGAHANDGVYTGSYAQPYNGNIGVSGGPVGAGNDTIYAGNGNDDLQLGNGNNFVQLGSGRDNVYGGMGNDTIIAGSGDDYIHGGGGTTYLQGGAGHDTLAGGDGNNVILGGSGDSTLIAAAGPTSSYAGASLEQNYVDGGRATTRSTARRAQTR
jgi:Ca2+-binding RTX toxin-like protein